MQKVVWRMSEQSEEPSLERLEAPLKSELPERVEVRVRRERRRRWTIEEKLRIVREMLEPGAVALRVAERHEISTGLLFTWRRQLMAQATAPGFMPVQVMPAAVPASAPQAPATGVPGGGIEIEMPSGIRIRAGHGTDLKLLRSVLSALDVR